MGLTLEGKMAYLNKFQIQAGATLQQSHYSEPHVWNKEAPAVKKMMRTPNTYGYFTATYTPVKPLSIALSDTSRTCSRIPRQTDYGQYGRLLRYRSEGGIRLQTL